MIAIDIETTGLDPKQDAIIELAAVRFNGGQVEDTFQTLVYPNRPIPSNITALTHITNEMVRNAPQLKDVILQFDAFIGKETVIGHNVGFDLAFLRQIGILKENRALDTYELAAVILPTAPRYNLGVLASHLGITVNDQHRALADCHTTRQLYSVLVQKLFELPLELLIDILSLTTRISWSESDILRQVVRRRVDAGEKAVPVFNIPFPHLKNDTNLEWEELKPADTFQPLDSDELSAILEYGGAFSKRFANYEQRPQQLEMLRTVSDAFSNGKHVFIEAGTGTGKSYAYLIPAFHWAIHNSERVIISTNTINLQDQLMSKDIPELAETLEADLRASVLKGRGNYLCPRRFQMMHSRGADSAEELRVMAKIMVWLIQGGKGDRGQLNLNGPIEREIWNRLSAEYEGCHPSQCPHFHKGTCAFYAARDRALRSHVIIINHALLLSDLAYGAEVLPPYKYLVIDEAHHLESAATSALSARISEFDLNRMIQELGGSSKGILGRLQSALSDQLTAEDMEKLAAMCSEIGELSAEIEPQIHRFFSAIGYFMEEMREGSPLTVYGQQLRIIQAVRTASGWSDVEIIWDNTNQDFQGLLEKTDEVLRAILNIDDLNEEGMEQLDALQGLLRAMNEDRMIIDGLILEPIGNTVYWIDISAINNRLSLNSAPLMIGNLIEKMLWHEKESVILTSATLTTDNSFDYIRERLSGHDADELAVGSPFDYEESVLLYLPNDIPDPNQGSAQRMVEMTLTRLCKATGGRTLALFTSYAQLKRTSMGIAPELARAGISVFEQGEGASASALLDTFRETDQAILLGTRSFWEGVDIQGEKLSVVVIVKLPFDVPSDPIIAARSECFENPFAQYSLPEAILKFRQGFGRLIRSRSDRGIVVILDTRILTKRYGREFINSVPKCTQMVSSVRDLPREAQKWLNL